MGIIPPDDEKINEVLSSWDIGQVLGVTEIKPGMVYRIHRENGDPLILKNIGESIPRIKERFAFEVEVLCFLDERGIPVAVPFENDNGSRLLEKNGRLFTLSPCFQLKDSPHSIDLQGMARLNGNCGAAIGRLDVALAAFPSENLEKRTWTTNLPVDIRERWIPSIKKGASPFERTALEPLMEEAEELAWKSLAALRSQLIHRDCHQENIIIDADRVVGFIDFDHLSIGPRPFDLAYFIANMIQDDIESPDRSARWFSLFPAVLRGFNKENPLTNDEIESIPSLMVAMFIMFTGWFFEIGDLIEARSRLTRLRWVHENIAKITEVIMGALK